MGLSQSKKRSSDALAVVASPMPTTPTTPHNYPVDVNTSLNETTMLFNQDAEWLDAGEMRAMEDEDAVMVRELSATNTGDLSLEEWLRTREADTKMIVKIGSISTINKFMGRKTVEYTIETDTGTVRRRFKDFVALRHGLEVRFPGAVVAPLPGKKQFGKTEIGFLTKRKRMLQHFLQSIARHPFLSADDLFVEFIASTARFDRKTAWRPRSWLVKAQKWSVAARRWAQALIEAETPANPRATMETAMIELIAVQKHLQGLKGTLKRNSAAMASLSESIHDVSVGFQRSALQETQLVLFSGGNQPEWEPLHRVFAQAQSLSNQSQSVVERFPDQVDEAILTPIRFEMSYVDTFQEALRRTRFSINRLRQAISAYRQARDSSEMRQFKSNGDSALVVAVPAEVHDGQSPPQTAQLLSQNFAAEVEKQRKRLQKLRMIAVQAQFNARRDINGVLALELNRFKLERQLRMNKAFTDYSAVQQAQAEALGPIWANAGTFAGTLQPTMSSIQQHATAGPNLVDYQEHVNNINNDSSVMMNGSEDPSRIEPPPLSPDSSSFMENTISEENGGEYTQRRRASQLRAKYPFQGMHEDELDVNEGEMLVGDVDENNPEWIRAKSLTSGKVGLVPKTYVEEIEEGQGDAGAGGDDDDDFDNSGVIDKSNISSIDEDLRKNVDPTNFIKQTQDMLKGTKRTNADREEL